jgi:hypothetical protein
VLEEQVEPDGDLEGYTLKTFFSLADIDPNSVHLGGTRSTDRGDPFLRPAPDQVWFDTINHVQTIIRSSSSGSSDSRGDILIVFNKEFAPSFAAHLKRAAELCGQLSLNQTTIGGSLADTLRWLTDETSRQTSKYRKSVFVLTSEGSNGCSLVLEERVQADSDKKHTVKTSFSLADIDPSSIHIGGRQDTDFPGFYGFTPPNPDFVLLNTTNYVESITVKNDVFPDGMFPPDSRGALAIPLNAEFNMKFVPRLKRAAELCGGKKTSSPLPEFVREFDIPTATSAPIPSSQPLTAADLDDKHYEVIPRWKYRLCKEVGRDLRLEGGSYFQRTSAGGALLYYVGTYPDSVFRKTSVAGAHIKVLEVPSELADSKCTSLESAFPTVVERGPAYGWSSMYRYIEHGDNLFKDTGGMANRQEVDVSAPAGTDDIYCTHKFVVGSMVGVDAGYSLASWTPTRMEMSLFARSMLGKEGAHASLTLYVRYLPRIEREKFGDKFGCTPMPPPQYAHEPFQEPRQQKLPDGSLMYVVP